jgi:hypothetical protein
MNSTNNFEITIRKQKQLIISFCTIKSFVASLSNHLFFKLLFLFQNATAKKNKNIS